MTRCGMAAGVKLIIMSEFALVIANPDFSITVGLSGECNLSSHLL